MNRSIVRFVSCILIPAVVGADPAWASGIGVLEYSPVSVFTPCDSSLINSQAVVEPLDVGFAETEDRVAIAERKEAGEELLLPDSHGMSRRRSFWGLLATGIGFSSLLLGQETKTKQEPPPPVNRQLIPQAPAVERQNRLLTDAQWKDAWYLKDDSTDPRPLENQLRVVTNNSPKVGEKFYADREAWESLLVIQKDDGKYVTNRPDALHGAGVGTKMSTISQFLDYPGVSATQPKRRVETADFEPIDKNHPGFLHWRMLAQYAGRALRFAVDGVQVYSQNQVDMSYLQEHAEAFKVREAYADLEAVVFEEHEAAVSSWLNYANQAEKSAELREAAWILTRARDREQKSATIEGRPLTLFKQLQETTPPAVEAYNTSHNELEPLRVHWLGTIGHSDNDLSREATTSLHPQGNPRWPMTRDLFSLAGTVATLISNEGAADNVLISDTLPLPPADEWDTSRPDLPGGSYAPDSFLKISEPAVADDEIDETVASELESLFTATPPDAPLGTSPRQRFLKLQKDMIGTVQEEMIELQKLPTWNAGVHVDLGTLPFIAALLNWDYRRPGKSKILSLEDLKIELELRVEEIDQEIISNRKNHRDAWIEARSRRQTALAKLVDVRNQIVTELALRRLAIQTLKLGEGKTSADPITPALRIEQLKKEYARHLTEAWAAWQIMNLYTVEGQKRVVAETSSHYIQVLKKIDPTYEVTPEDLNPPLTSVHLPPAVDSTGTPIAKPKGSLLKRVLTKVTKALGVMIPGLLLMLVHVGTATIASAHAFLPQVAGAAAQAAGQLAAGGATIHQIALDVTLGKWNGGSENTLTGIAANILRSLPGYKGHLSQREIWDMVYKIADQNGIAHSNSALASFHPGDTLHIGSFDPDVASRLQGHQDPAMVGVHPVIAHASVHHIPQTSITPAAPIAAPAAPQSALIQSNPGIVHAQDLAPARPVSATPLAPHGNGFMDQFHHIQDSILNTAHFAWNWIVSNPEHYIPLIIAGIFLATYVWLRNRKSNIATNGSPYKAFSTNGPVRRMHNLSLIRKWGPAAIIALGVLKWLAPLLGSEVLHLFTLHNLMHGWSIPPLLGTWGIPAAVLFVGVTLAGFVPAIRNRPFLRKIFPPAVAATAILLVPGLSPWVRLLGFALAWGIFLIPNIEQVGRSRWAPVAAIPLLLLGVIHAGQRAGVAEKVTHFVSDTATNFSMADRLAANPGVSLQPVPPLPSIWIPGPHTGGVVTGVKPNIAPGDLAVALEPIDDGLANRLQVVNETWHKLYGSYLIAPNRISAATRHHERDAFVRIKPHYESSYDKALNSILEQIEEQLIAHDQVVTLAHEKELVNGSFVLPFEGKIQRFKLMKLGLDATSVLLARSELNVPFKRYPVLQPGTKPIAVGTIVRENNPQVLFTQAATEDDLLQIKMSPPDVRALINLWAKNPSGTSIKLKDSDGGWVDIPLDSIPLQPMPDDPTLGGTLQEEALQGGLTNNPALGAAKTISAVNLMVHHPNRTLTGQLADVAKRYEYQGIYVGAQRVIEASSGYAIGNLSAALPPAAQPPQKTLLAPLEEQLNANEALIEAYDTLEKEVRSFQAEYPESGAAPLLMADYEARKKELASKAEDLRRQREEIQAAGIQSAKGNIQARDPFRHSHYALENPTPTDSLDEGEITWGNTVLLQVSFYATPETIPTGNDMEVRIPGTDEFVKFHKAGYRSLDRTKDVRLYFLRTELPAAEARRFYPPKLPMTYTHVEIKLAAETPGIFTRLLGHFRPEPAAGPAQLTGRELRTTSIWIAAMAFAALMFGLDSHAFIAAMSGLVLAVLTHEYAGHGLSALRNIKQPTRLRPINGNLEWQVQSESGTWQTLLNRKVQKAGPRASRILAVLGVALLLVQIILGVHIVYPMLIVYSVVASYIFRHADRSFPTSEEDQVLLNELDAPKPLPALEQAQGRNRPVIRMSHEKLVNLSDSLQNTALEEERFWYKGQKTNYLTVKQKIWDVLIRRRSKVQLTLPNLYYRRFVRDDVTYRQSTLIYDHWQLENKEGTASAKTRTFQWVHLAIFMGVIYLIIGGPDAIRDFASILQANPMFLFAFDTRNIAGMVLGIVVGTWILLAALESIGKFFSTLGWNLLFYKQHTLDRFSAAEKSAKENTGRDGPDELTKMDKVKILLRPEIGAGKARRLQDEYNQFLDNLEQFSSLVTAATVRVLNQDPPQHPSEAALAFENAFRIQASRSRSSSSPIYRGKTVSLASESTLRAQVTQANPRFEELNEQDQYRLLTNARVEEAKRLAALYPMHALVALLRSGNTELLASMAEDEDGGLMLEIVEKLKERLNSLDNDAYDDLRAQERFDDFFDTLHKVYEGLIRPVTVEAERTRRNDLLQFLSEAVTPFERKTWDEFQGQIDQLAATDPNIIRGVAYVLTARLLKRNESLTLETLEALDHETYSKSDVHRERYLRNAEHSGSTSVIQLKMAYQKYFDLVKEFDSRFPGKPLLGKRNIYILLENTVNYRQTLREVALMLPQITGNIYLVNVSETHNDFAKSLDDGIAERFSWRDRGRIKVRSVDVWNVWNVKKTWFGAIKWPRPWELLRSIFGERFAQRMRNDPNGIIFSSATPTEWTKVRQSVGAKVHETSPLLKLGLFVGLVREFNPDVLTLLTLEARHQIADQYRVLRARRIALIKKTQSWPSLQEAGQQQRNSNVVERLSISNWLLQMAKQSPLASRAVSLVAAQEDLSRNQKAIDSLEIELDDLNYLEHEFNNVRNFLPLINSRLVVLHNNEPPPLEPPIFVPEDPLNPNYVLDAQAYILPKNGGSASPWYARWISKLAPGGRPMAPRAEGTAA